MNKKLLVGFEVYASVIQDFEIKQCYGRFQVEIDTCTEEFEYY